MTTTAQGIRQAQLPRSQPQPGDRAREIRSGLLASVALLAVLAGVPAALAAFVGNPLPATPPSREWLTADLTAGVIIDAVALALWLAWAHFAVCVVVELRMVVRGRALPRWAPVGKTSHATARRLVASAVLLSTAATLAPLSSAASVAPAPGRVAAAVTSQQAAHTAPAAVSGGSATDSRRKPVQLDDRALFEKQETLVYYEVRPPDGRRYDCLWDLAERTLGDPLRYKEIFALNKDRVQADGRRLVDANLIFPGWILVLPPDGKGPGVATVPSDVETRPGATAATAGAADDETRNGTRLPETLDRPVSIR